jgi:hypothetical protein
VNLGVGTWRGTSVTGGGVSRGVSAGGGANRVAGGCLDGAAGILGAQPKVGMRPAGGQGAGSSLRSE